MPFLLWPQLRALNKAMEATIATLACLHINLALVRRDTVLSASKMVRDKHNVRSLCAQPLKDDALFAGQVAPFVAKESANAKAFREASQAAKRQASGPPLARSHSEPKKAKPSPSPAPPKGQGHTPRYGNKGKKAFFSERQPEQNSSMTSAAPISPSFWGHGDWQPQPAFGR